MILLDVNVVVYAFTTTEPAHAATRSWLERALTAGTERVALTESTVSGFVRIVTNPRIYAVPAPTSEAVAFVDAIVSSGRATWLPPNDTTWATFRQLVADDRGVRAGLVPDAWLAAMAIAHGTKLASADKGLARFPNLDLIDPTR